MRAVSATTPVSNGGPEGGISSDDTRGAIQQIISTGISISPAQDRSHSDRNRSERQRPRNPTPARAANDVAAARRIGEGARPFPLPHERTGTPMTEYRFCTVADEGRVRIVTI